MYNGVKAMIEKEKELRPKEEVKHIEEEKVKHAEAEKVKHVEEEKAKHVEEEKDIEVGPHLKEPSDIKGFPIFPRETHSLLSKYLTKEIWN